VTYSITYQVDLFNGAADLTDSESFIRDALYLLLSRDITFLKSHPNAPMLYRTGLRYREEPRGEENWRDIPTCLREGDRGNPDCEDLSCWRAAEVNVRYGILAVPIFSHRTLANGDVVYHIRVQYPNGHIEDPSRVLGMGQTSAPRYPLLGRLGK
jgi:hypothetical protein